MKQNAVFWQIKQKCFYWISCINFEKKLQHNEDFDFKRWEKEIRRVVESGIIERYYYESGRGEYELQTDKDVRHAIDMLHNRKQMHKILSGEPDA